jgi:hypothetical protein
MWDCAIPHFRIARSGTYTSEYEWSITAGSGCSVSWLPRALFCPHSVAVEHDYPPASAVPGQHAGVVPALPDGEYAIVGALQRVLPTYVATQSPNFDDWSPFGGWTTPAAKQVRRWCVHALVWWRCDEQHAFPPRRRSTTRAARATWAWTTTGECAVTCGTPLLLHPHCAVRRYP